MNRTQLLRLGSIVGAFLVGLWLPFRLLGFAPSATQELFSNVLIASVSFINIIHYFTEHDLNPRKFRSWLNVGVILDALCFLPLSFIAFALFDVTLGWILFLNLTTIRHINHVRAFLDGFPSLKPLTYRLAPLAVFLPLLVHLVACGWIALGSGTSGPETDHVLAYVKAVYWTFTTLTTVGYGDIAAKTIPQMIYCCCVQVAGVGVFGFILSNVAGIVARSDAAREHHMDNLDKIETFMNIHHTPSALRANVRSYYHYMWKTKKGYHDKTLLDDLPAKIQSELIMHINRPIIEKVPFLRGADQDLLSELMNELEPRIFVPGEKVFKVDEHGDSLYFIQSGSVEIVTRDGNVVATLGDGSFFGEMALVSEKPRTATVRATTFCDAYLLHRDAFDRVSTSYPEFRKHLEEVMNDRKAS
ncbi:MAG: cyclic nucleotide-binding domain-containing protein [Bdellovibrionota bacterium]